jgi:hypothetical protein
VLSILRQRFGTTALPFIVGTIHNHVPVSELIEHIDELANALEAFENV